MPLSSSPTIQQAGSVSRPLIGFMPALCLIFVIAKLFGYISWSWWLVFLPIYIFPVIFLAIVVLSALVGAVLWLALRVFKAFSRSEQA